VLSVSRDFSSHVKYLVGAVRIRHRICDYSSPRINIKAFKYMKLRLTDSVPPASEMTNVCNIFVEKLEGSINATIILKWILMSQGVWKWIDLDQDAALSRAFLDMGASPSVSQPVSQSVKKLFSNCRLIILDTEIQTHRKVLSKTSTVCVRKDNFMKFCKCFNFSIFLANTQLYADINIIAILNMLKLINCIPFAYFRKL
jgi:hypothetical protein